MSTRLRTVLVLALGVVSAVVASAERGREHARREDELWAAANENLASSDH